ncbi:VOC family protein [Anatilimnocola sp. NA78]|uniref:VOC family protein n=1 Tax=Anatilimnocola sp. NA78 TaxID=3415683 RepID=UPI003CE53777
MSDFNSERNRVVWVDIPVQDLDRALAFYRAVLANDASKQEYSGGEFGLLDHENGNGGCLVKNAAEVSATSGLLVYFNADGRIRDAVAQAEKLGSKILEPVHSIGPHGFRAVLLDSEGNKIALHSNRDG